jgi:hypothetical protein
MTDNLKFSRFAINAAEIKESGRWAAINEKIVCLANNSGDGNEWQVALLGALCFQVFTEYHLLQDAYVAERADPSLLAWRARNLLELSVWSTYFVRSRENARRLYEDAGRDAMELLNAFESWGQKAGQPVDWLSAIADGKSGLSGRAASEGIENLSGKYMNVSKAADECGLKEMFITMNKLLSKFAHPTAMQILGMIDENKTRLQRDTFYELGCNFFVGAFNALETSIPFVGDKLQT